MAALILGLLVAANASAGSVGEERPESYLDFYHSPLDDGEGSFDSFDDGGPGGEGLTTYARITNVLHLWFDPTTVNQQRLGPDDKAPGVASVSEVEILASGSLRIESFTGCEGLCLRGNPVDPTTTLFFSYQSSNEDLTEPVRIGTVEVSGVGSFDLSQVAVFASDLQFPTYRADAIATNVPEPVGIWPLGLALAGVGIREARRHGGRGVWGSR